MPEDRWAAEFRRMRKAVRKLGLRRGEVERLMLDARQFLSDAAAAGAAPDRLRLVLTSEGVGHAKLHCLEVDPAEAARVVH